MVSFVSRIRERLGVSNNEQETYGYFNGLLVLCRAEQACRRQAGALPVFNQEKPRFPRLTAGPAALIAEIENESARRGR
jgi:hypothetical protein